MIHVWQTWCARPRKWPPATSWSRASQEGLVRKTASPTLAGDGISGSMGFPQKARFCSTNTPAQHALQPRPSLQPAASRMTQWCAGSPQVGSQGGTRADGGALQGEVDGEHLCLTTHAGDQPPHLHGAQVTPAGVFLGWWWGCQDPCAPCARCPCAPCAQHRSRQV